MTTASLPDPSMRITYFTDTTEIGGAERNLADMAIVSVDAGHDVAILAPQQSVVDYMAAAVPGADCRRGGSDAYHSASSERERVRKLLSQLRVLRTLFKDLDTDLLHVNNGGFPGSDLCRIAPLAARLAGVPHRVMTVHSNPWARDHLANPRVQALADRLVWSNVDAVFCPSRAVEAGLEERRGLPARLGHQFLYGVGEPAAGTEAEISALRARLAPDEEFLVGMVSARAVPEKGYDVFAEALEMCGDDVRGALVGPIPDWDFVGALAAERLTIEGVVRPVGSHYRAFDVVVVPSTAEECMPLVILEAMAAGRPVIGSRLSGIPEAIVDGATGMTFPIGDVAALAAAIREAAGDPARLKAMGAAGRRRWEERFTPEVMRATQLALYAAVTSRN